MFQKIPKINLDNLNIIILIISIFFYLTSIIITKNILIIFILFLINFILFINIKRNKYITFLTSILPVIIISYILLSFINLNLPFDYLKLYQVIVKTFLIIDYIFLIINIIKNRKIKYIKVSKRNHTFNELRKKNINRFQNDNLDYIKKYIIDNDIDIKSDYYKVIIKNIKLKTINDLEEYVTLNYLRFYKNKKYNHRNIFDKLNLVFLGIHVIILMVVFLMR